MVIGVTLEKEDLQVNREEEVPMDHQVKQVSREIQAQEGHQASPGLMGNQEVMGNPDLGANRELMVDPEAGDLRERSGHLESQEIQGQMVDQVGQRSNYINIVATKCSRNSNLMDLLSSNI